MASTVSGPAAAVLGSNTVPILISVAGASPSAMPRRLLESASLSRPPSGCPRVELQAAEEEAVRALWQIADDTGR
jgi:hypothetical protein